MNHKWLLLYGVMLSAQGLLAQGPSPAAAPLYASARSVRNEADAPAAISVTGTVTDEKGGALPGATVSLKGSSIGTNTDANGAYTLRIPDGTNDPVLVFSFIGY